MGFGVRGDLIFVAAGIVVEVEAMEESMSPVSCSAGRRIDRAVCLKMWVPEPFESRKLAVRCLLLLYAFGSRDVSDWWIWTLLLSLSYLLSLLLVGLCVSIGCLANPKMCCESSEYINVFMSGQSFKTRDWKALEKEEEERLWRQNTNNQEAQGDRRYLEWDYGFLLCLVFSDEWLPVFRLIHWFIIHSSFLHHPFIIIPNSLKTKTTSIHPCQFESCGTSSCVRLDWLIGASVCLTVSYLCFRSLGSIWR